MNSKCNIKQAPVYFIYIDTDFEKNWMIHFAFFAYKYEKK